MGPDRDEEFDAFSRDLTEELLDQIQEYVDNMNAYLRADEERDALRVLRLHPELTNETGKEMLTKFIGDAERAGDETSARFLSERLRLLRRFD